MPRTLEEGFHFGESFETPSKSDLQDREEILTPVSHEAIIESVSLQSAEAETEPNRTNEINTKPYYPINAKLNQREKKTNFKLDGGHSSSSVKEECQSPMPEVIKPPLTDLNFKPFVGSNPTPSPSPARILSCNKSSVTCLICGKQLSNQYNLRVHMETHSNSSYSCTACSHVSRSRDALRKHVSYRHPTTNEQKRPRYSTTKP